MNMFKRWQLSLRRKDKEFLFDGDDAVFKALLPQTTTYAEYGVGKSSLWVLANSHASIFAVDTSEYWIDHVRSKAGESAARFDIDWVDLGPIGWAGRPKNYARRTTFQRYIESPWNRGQKPEVILVDGRFRVACFLYSSPAPTPDRRSCLTTIRTENTTMWSKNSWSLLGFADARRSLRCQRH